MNQRTRRKLFLLLTLAIAYFAISAPAQDHNRMQVIPETGHDTSQPLRDLESGISNQTVAVPQRIMPVLRPHPTTTATAVQRDPVLQTTTLLPLQRRWD